METPIINNVILKDKIRSNNQVTGNAVNPDPAIMITLQQIQAPNLNITQAVAFPLC